MLRHAGWEQRRRRERLSPGNEGSRRDVAARAGGVRLSTALPGWWRRTGMSNETKESMGGESGDYAAAFVTDECDARAAVLTWRR
jgi:hypothetical protein